MKIGYVLEQFPKLSETFILEEMLELERLGVNLTVFALSDPQESQVHEKVKLLKAEVVRPAVVATHASPVRWARPAAQLPSVGVKNYLWGMLISSWLADEAKKRNINHLHAHFAGDAAFVAMLASQISQIPYSFTAHAGGLFGWPYLLKEKVAGAKFVVAISEFNKKFLGGADKIKVIHCGLDLSKFETRKQENKKTEKQKNILTVARLEEKKGHRYLLEALKILKDKNFKFRSTIVGGGVLEKDLKSQTRSLGLEDVVDFIGPLTQNEVQKLLRQTDVFVLPCVKAKNGNMDGIPVSLMEAMASGVPVISTTLSGIPELIENGQSGLLVEPKDVESLAAAIEEILTDDDLRQRCTQQARIKVEEEFDIKKNAQELKRLLFSVGNDRKEDSKGGDSFGRDSDGGFYYGEIPREGMKRFLVEAEETSVLEAIDNFLIPNFEKGEWLKKYIADDSRADWRFLLPTHPTGVILDIGCGFGGVSIPLSEMFGKVVAADPTFERVETVRLRCRDEGIDNVKTVQANALNLPFEDKSFDGVVMMGVLEWVAVGHQERVKSLQQKALSEIFRVLKPGGFFVLGIENRFGYNYFLGEEDEHSHLKFTTLMPRFLANLVSRYKLYESYRTYTYSYFGYQKLLRKAGFSDLKFWGAIPKYRYPDFVIDFSKPEPLSYYIDSVGKKTGFKKYGFAVIKILHRLGIWKYFFPTFIVVSKKVETGHAPSLQK